MVNIDVGKKFTSEEYLELENISATRHEFYYGNIFEMAGITLIHNLMQKKIARILDGLLSMLGYESFTNDVKLMIEKDNVYLYPDVVVAKINEQTLSTYFIQNPILVVEILSDSTRKHDSTDKFIQYSKLESLQYYLLVEPEKHIVIVYEKLNGEWFSKPFTELTEEVKLPLLGVSFSLGEIYG